MREWEECVWKAGTCLFKETKVDIKGEANLGRCKKKDGRRTQCIKLEGCIYVEENQTCTVDYNLKSESKKCGTEVKLIKYGNAAKTGLPLKVDTSCDCEDSCSEYTAWKFKRDSGECTCYDPPKGEYLFVEDLKLSRKKAEGKFTVNVDRPCFVDCPWMLDLDG